MKESIMRRLMLVAVAACFSTSTPAAEQWASSTLKFVYPLGNGNFVLAFNDAPATCPATGNPKYFYAVAGENGVTADGLKAMLGTSLAAFVSGKRIQAAFSDATASCYINRLLIID